MSDAMFKSSTSILSALHWYVLRRAQAYCMLKVVVARPTTERSSYRGGRSRRGLASVRNGPGCQASSGKLCQSTVGYGVVNSASVLSNSYYI